MKKDLLALIEENNSRAKGVQINVPTVEYVEKIFLHSTIVPYFASGRLYGFISYYNNDPNKEVAFLTLLLISDSYRGKGLGKLLLETSIKDLKTKGFLKYGLEVLKDNQIAIKLYEGMGFVKIEERSEYLFMQRDLTN